MPSIQSLRRTLGGAVIEGVFRGASTVARALPLSNPRRHGVEVLRDLAYSDTGLREHRLDVYRPVERSGPLPVVFYVHGGGFRILSKDTHWPFGLMFAKHGYLVFSIDYRLSPRHRFPAAVEDTFLAWRWVVRECERFGGDPARIVVAGESAGANLVTGLSFAACAKRSEPWARAVFENGVVPVAALPACGLHQVSDPERYVRQGRVSRLVADRMSVIHEDYLGGEIASPLNELADPLVWAERGLALDRPLPPFFLPVGTADVLEDDNRRLDAAIRQNGGQSEAAYYEGGIHAFHAFLFDKTARRCWRDTFDFLDRHLTKGETRKTA